MKAALDYLGWDILCQRLENEQRIVGLITICSAFTEPCEILNSLPFHPAAPISKSAVAAAIGYRLALRMGV